MQGTRRKTPAAGPGPEAVTVSSDTIVLESLDDAMRPVLYLDIVGTIVLQDGSTFRLAAFSRDFVNAIKNRFKVVFLTSLSESTAANIATVLGLEATYGIYRRGLGKVSGIDFANPFLWVDDAPNSRDLMRLAEERCSGRLLTVNSKEGVTRATLKKLEVCLEALGNDQAQD